GVSFTDGQTEWAMSQVLDQTGYLLDPHGAIAFLGLSDYLDQHPGLVNGLFLETADPAKFAEEVERITGQTVSIPDRLKAVFLKETQTIAIPACYTELKKILLKTAQL